RCAQPRAVLLLTLPRAMASFERAAMEPALDRQHRLMAPTNRGRSTMPIVLAVALGGAVGATARYGADQVISMHSTFPWSTFVVNVVGCFLIGWFSELFGDSPDWLRSGMIV